MGVVYQIFVDRFARLEGAENGFKSWDSPLEGGVNEFYGGNLKGIISKVDHIASLGVDTLYLTPIFESPSNHRYDTLDFFKIDETVGDEADLKNLVKSFHSRGIKIILDGVFNHVSAKSDMAKAMGTETRWRGFPDLVELDLGNPEVLGSILDVVDRWMDAGIDGFRIDCANDVGMGPLDEIRKKIRSKGGIMIGEVMGYASDWLNHMDGVMNYFFKEATLALLNDEISTEHYVFSIERMLREYPEGALANSWSILSSHDTPRLSNVLEEEEAVRSAIALQYFFPGNPMIYYGEELGMTGGPDPYNRAPMVWGTENSRLGLYRVLGELRSSKELLNTGRIDLWNTDSTLVVLRYTTHEDFAILLVNPTDRDVRFKTMVPYPYLFDGLKLEGIFSQESAIVRSGALNFSLEPFGFEILIPKDDVRGYTFFKNR